MKAALYIRVSTEDQAREGFSLDAQHRRLEAYCRVRGWEIAGVYRDEGHSGRSTARPAYKKMMEERENWDIVLVLKMDRIHRNSKNFMMMMEDLERWGKSFASATESLDTSNALGRFVMDMIQRLAQLESEQIGERTYMGMKEKAESGSGHMGFRIPFGYKLEEGVLVIQEDEAALVRWMFHFYLEGMSLDSMAYTLNNRMDSSTRNGNPWTKYNLRTILHNPIYAGYLKWDGLLISSDHEAIISVDEFNKVQRLMASMMRVKTKRRWLHLPYDLEGASDINRFYECIP